MLLGRNTLQNLQKDLIELRINLSDTITSIYSLREKIREQAAELSTLPEKIYFSHEDKVQIANLKTEAESKSGLDKVHELTEVFKQADMLSETIFADGVKGLQTELLENLRNLMMQAVKDMLNAFYFSKLSEPTVGKIIDEFLLRNPQFSHLIHAKRIYFNSEMNRTEFLFTEALSQMSFSRLIQCANEVMWAIEKAGVRNGQETLVQLHDIAVIDGKFGDYLRCERWLMSGGYFWLTIVPQTKNFVENELASQETEDKYYSMLADLKKMADEKMAVAKSNLNVDITLEKKITELRVKLIKEARAAATIYEHQKKLYKSQPVVCDAENICPSQEDGNPSSVNPCLRVNDEESKPSIEVKQIPLIDQLLALLEAVLMDSAIEKYWGKPVWFSVWSNMLLVGGKYYQVPPCIYRARMELNQYEEQKQTLSKIDFVQKICAHLRNDEKDQLSFYGAINQFFDGENFIIDEEKIMALRQVIKKEMAIHLQDNLDFNLRTLSPR